MVLKGFFANINMKLKKNLEVMDVGAELSIKSNPLTSTSRDAQLYIMLYQHAWPDQPLYITFTILFLNQSPKDKFFIQY